MGSYNGGCSGLNSVRIIDEAERKGGGGSEPRKLAWETRISRVSLGNQVPEREAE